jgi:hypothetical protein
VTVDTPPAGGPDTGCPGEIDLVLRGLAAELRSHGVEAREDGVHGIVHAGPQHALLRPHRGDLWWWMRWPGEPLPLAGVPLSPATRTSEAVRRILGALDRT